jgi:hypothetical protein
MEDLPNRKLEAVTAIDFADDGQAAAVRGPIRPFHVFEHFPRGAACGHPHAGERAARFEGSHGMAAQREGRLARTGDCQDIGARESEGSRFGTLGAADEDLDRPALPRRSIEDHLTVGSETGV